MSLTFLDTTSSTLTYLFWELAKNPYWQDRLREELSEVKYSDALPPYNAISNLPVLDALIHEVLRLHPAAPASLPRETPAGGRDLNGIYIPEKVKQFQASNLHGFFVNQDVDHCFHAMLHNPSGPCCI